jgi:hypothetical protein
MVLCKDSIIVNVDCFLENAEELHFIVLEREKRPPTTLISHMGTKYESMSHNTMANLKRQNGPDQTLTCELRHNNQT